MVAKSSAPEPIPVRSPAVDRIKKRRDFLAVRNGARSHGRAFVLQAAPRDDGDPRVRFGFTVTKKCGNAVTRNRIKRRLREMVRHCPTQDLRELVGTDIVVVARPEAVRADFAALQDSLSKGLRQIVANGRAKGQKRRDKAAAARHRSTD